MNARARVLPTLQLFFLFATAAACQTSESPAAYPSQGALAERIHSIVSAPAVSRAHWGVAVTTVDGAPIFGMNEGQFFRPASNAKLFTTATAMALLGPDATFTTKIYGKLDAASGTVEGDLVLVGGGDPSFGSGDLPYVAPGQRPKNPPPAPPALQDLREMVDQLVAKGVKRVTGRIVGDDTLFPYAPYPATWDSGDAVWGYGAPVSALTIADNQLLLTVVPQTLEGGQAVPVKVTLEQNGLEFYKVASQALTTRLQRNTIAVERFSGSRDIRIFGDIGDKVEPDLEHLAITDPAIYAALTLRLILVQRGIQVDGDAAAHHWPRVIERGAVDVARQVDSEHLRRGAPMLPVFVCFDGRIERREPLATHTSAPLQQEIVFTNKVSQNLHAELILKQLDPAPRCAYPEGTDLEQVRKFLISAGLFSGDFLFYDGSGLSSHDLVTPRATAKLLSYASTQPWFAQWKASLPVGGEDGTLRARFGEKSPLKDHIFAKTGTLGESRALSGYLDAASGKTVIFSILVDTHTPTSSADREAMDAVVEAIAAAN